MNKRKLYPNPQWASEEDDIKEMFAAFGVGPTATGAEEETEETPEDNVTPDDTTTPEDNTTEEGGEGASTEEGENTPPKTNPPKVDKAAQAFAQMRVQNKNMEKLLKGFAEVLGVKTDKPEDLLGALQEKVTTVQAKQQGVPPELLSRLQALEEKEQAYNQEMARRNAFTGFQAVKNQFGLDDKALQSFADELVADGLNPFEQEVDLESQYLKRHFKDIVAAAEARGAQAEIARASKAQNQSSKPTGKAGKEEGLNGDAKINTISDLNKWFDTLGK